MEDKPPVEGDKAVYEETLYYGPWLWVLVVGLIALYVAVLIGAVAKGQGWLGAVFGVIVVALIALLANFWRLDFVITGAQVIFGFGLIKKRFELSDVQSCEPYTLEFRNYYGYGIRSGRDGTIAYNTRNGRGIKLVAAGRRKPYVVSLDDPKRVCELILGVRSDLISRGQVPGSSDAD